ncbi:MAG: hypothetical protein ACUVXA_13170 [Candidatus Jordarchaeum sp.]|uniref:hypothetical protein n=1 Tax=Candidatus Jordarchaeum sp. TaxID=2823881 RepID=UPI00404B2186
MNRVAKTIFIFILLFFLVYLLPVVLPLWEFWDLIVQAPFVALSSMVFYKVIVAEKKPKEISDKKMLMLQAFMVLSFFIFFEGHGMHFTANSVEVLIAENLPFIYLASLVFPMSNIPAQIYFWTIYPKIYYFDEMLGHQLVYTGFFLLLVSGIVLEIWTGEHKPLERIDYAAIIVAAGIAGFMVVQAVIEGQFVPQTIVLSIAILIGFPLATRGRVSLKESPFALFVIITVILLLVGILLYGLTTDPLYAAFAGPWPQPSEAKRLLNQFLVFNFWDELKWLLLLQ